jgi:hypothetical protein
MAKIPLFGGIFKAGAHSVPEYVDLDALVAFYVNFPDDSVFPYTGSSIASFQLC